MRFLLILTLFLTACTDATTQVSRLFNFNGPNFDQSNLSISSMTDFEIKGSCLPKFNRFEISFDNASFQSISPYLSQNHSQLIDCSNSSFSIWIDPNLLVVSQNKAIFYLRQVSDKDYTESSRFELSITTSSTPTPPVATTTVPTITNSDLSLTVSGSLVETYKWKVGASSLDCSTSTGWTENPVSSQISILKSTLSDGQIKLCLIGGNQTSGYQAFSSASTYTWTLDTTAPSTPVLTNAPNSYDNSTNYSVSVISTGSSIIYGKLSNSNDCSTKTNYSTISGGVFNFSIAQSSDLANAIDYICFYSVDSAGNESAIQSYSWTQDMTNPSAPTGSLSNTVLASSSQSPTISVNLPTQTSPQSPIASIWVKIEDSSNGTVLNWTDKGLSTSFVLSSLTLIDSVYYAKVKIKDSAGNFSSESLIGSWRVDTSAPVISSKVVKSIPFSRRQSPIFNVVFSDPSGISEASARIVNQSGVEVKGSIPIVSGVDFSFSGNMGFDRNETYSLEIFLKDSLLNVKTEGLSFNSANCVESDPNDFSVNAGICDEYIGSVLGWKMMGGELLGTDPHDASYILVVDTSAGAYSTGILWGSTTSGIYESSISTTVPAFFDFSTVSSNTGAILACQSKTVNSFQNWFLPTAYQMTKFICNSNWSGSAGVSAPSSDPNCVSSGKSTHFTIPGIYSTLGTSTENTSLKYFQLIYSFLSFSSKSKSLNLDNFICFRRFKRNSP